ncbi:RES family NAD+ phosphorylase [Proteus alimentorum]|uniref:RES family NAD+ phosphorylase n=1 Tax=Proteus alimentorum TaxID=1973495 RepID=UPI000BFFA68C|nr:RES family NAD+ phosphorylase [Proteus alimentorum]
MPKWKFNETIVAQGIGAQKKSGRIPEIDIQQGSGLLKRHQRKLYESAINFSAPIKKDDCGRYNPPGGSVAVWYASDSALTAAAEAYGRLFHRQRTISYPESVLSQHYMCSVDVVRTVKVIDVVELCELLHIPLDSLENEDYTFTQWLMEHLYTHFKSDYDGIAYTSRHKRYKRCYAFWERPDSTPAFTDTPQGMVPYASYVETDKGMFPKGWNKGTMSGEEIFEELLGFEITLEPM